MRSFKFPNMFGSTSSQIWKENEYNQATKQNLLLLLQSERGELRCDPYFGVLLKHYLFNQNNYILKDVLIDTLYTQVAIFLPQIKVKRENITLITDKYKGHIYANITGINQIDYTHNTYNLLIFDESKQLA